MYLALQLSVFYEIRKGQELLPNCGLGRDKILSWQGEGGLGPLPYSDLRLSGAEAEDIQVVDCIRPAFAFGGAKWISGWNVWWVH